MLETLTLSIVVRYDDITYRKLIGSSYLKKKEQNKKSWREERYLNSLSSSKTLVEEIAQYKACLKYHLLWV